MNLVIIITNICHICTIPPTDLFRYLPTNPNIRLMCSILRLSFGDGIRLTWRFRSGSFGFKRVTSRGLALCFGLGVAHYALYNYPFHQFFPRHSKIFRFFRRWGFLLFETGLQRPRTGGSADHGLAHGGDGVGRRRRQARTFPRRFKDDGFSLQGSSWLLRGKVYLVSGLCRGEWGLRWDWNVNPPSR